MRLNDLPICKQENGKQPSNQKLCHGFRRHGLFYPESNEIDNAISRRFEGLKHKLSSKQLNASRDHKPKK